jgi:hypothetical protein
MGAADGVCGLLLRRLVAAEVVPLGQRDFLAARAFGVAAAVQVEELGPGVLGVDRAGRPGAGVVLVQ